jgi:hypothetical protein
MAKGPLVKSIILRKTIVTTGGNPAQIRKGFPLNCVTASVHWGRQNLFGKPNSVLPTDTERPHRG